MRKEEMDVQMHKDPGGDLEIRLSNEGTARIKERLSRKGVDVGWPDNIDHASEYEKYLDDPHY